METFQQMKKLRDSLKATVLGVTKGRTLLTEHTHATDHTARAAAPRVLQPLRARGDLVSHQRTGFEDQSWHLGTSESPSREGAGCLSPSQASAQGLQESSLGSQGKDKAKSSRRLCSGWVTDLGPHPGEGQWWSRVCRQGQHIMDRAVISRGEGAERPVLLRVPWKSRKSETENSMGCREEESPGTSHRATFLPAPPMSPLDPGSPARLL